MKRLFIIMAALSAAIILYGQTPGTVAEPATGQVQPVEDNVSAPVEARGDSLGFKIEQKEEGNGSYEKYRRSSLYSVLMTHSSFPYGPEIQTAFYSIPMPDKFNDHNLNIREFESSMARMKKSGNKKDATNLSDVSSFLKMNGVARSLVAKWFNRNPETGAFDVSLVQERGYYDASQQDIALASLTERNLSILGDAGEDLIGKTYMIINDITFVDKGEQSAKAAEVVSLLGSLAGAIMGSQDIANMGKAAAALTNEIDGFTVNITSYLFRLKWDNDIAAEFYKMYWINQGEINIDRKAAFEGTNLFEMVYLGKSSTSAANLSSKSCSALSKESQMLKVCARAVDKSIVELQRSYEEFKVKTPIYQINDNRTVQIQIGLKEGVNSKCKYEVLQPVQDEKGHYRYNRVGMLQPIAGKIWDNRYGALEDAAIIEKDGGKDADGAEGNVHLTSTTFKVLSGASQITLGCLVREASIK